MIGNEVASSTGRMLVAVRHVERLCTAQVGVHSVPSYC